MRISVCMITKNEEHNIARSIKSYQDIVDEIIVVDSESTDDTVRIARSLGADVYIRPWTNDFAAARNAAIEKASGDWIVIVDADEYWEKASREALEDAVRNALREGADGISVPACEKPEGALQAFGHGIVIRIVRNNGTIRYQNKVHEQLYKVNGEPVRVFRSEAFTLYHTGYRQEHLEGKARRNLAILRAEGAMRDEYYYHYFMAECCHGLSLYDECLEHISALFALPDFEQMLYTAAKMFRIYQFQISIMLHERHRYSEAEIGRFVREAMDAFGKHPEIRLQEMRYHATYFRIDEAIKAFEEAFKLHREYTAPYENGFAANPADKYLALAELYRMKNDTSSARQIVLEALVRYQGEDRLVALLFRLLYGMELPEKRKIIENILPLHGADDIHYMQNIGQLSQAAWMRGHHDLYADYVLALRQRYPQIDEVDHNISARISLLQGDYAGVIRIVAAHEGEPAFDRLADTAKLLMQEQAEPGGAYSFVQTIQEPDADKQDFERAAAVIEALLQIGLDARAEELARSLCGMREAEESARLDDKAGQPEENRLLLEAQKKITLAVLFEQFGRWIFSGTLFFAAAQALRDEEVKGAQYINAAQRFYMGEDIPAVLSALRQGLPYAVPGNHLPIEILRWIGANSKENDAEAYKEANTLLAAYKQAYQLSYDKPSARGDEKVNTPGGEHDRHEKHNEADKHDEHDQSNEHNRHDKHDRSNEHKCLTISVCMITKNEEKNIARALLSCKDCADEIIVVDSESTDDTVKIAKSLGADVYIRPWTNDFAAARNAAIEKAGGDWIITLDADEYFEEGRGEQIRQLIAQADADGADSILSYMSQTNQSGTKRSGINLIQRIFKNHTDIWYESKIHERLVKRGGQIKAVTSDVVLIFHTGYDLAVVKDKAARNMKYLLDDTLDMEKHLLYYYRAEGYHTLGRYEECIKEARMLRALPVFGDMLHKDQNMYRIYIYEISSMLQNKERYGKTAIGALVREAAEQFPLHPEIKLMEMLYDKDYGRIDESIAAFEAACKLNESYRDTYDNSFSAHVDAKYRMTAALYEMKRDRDGALAYAAKAIKADRTNPENVLALFSVLRDFNAEDRSKLLEDLFDMNEPADMTAIMAGSWYVGLTDTFAAYFLRCLKQWPQQIVQDQHMLCKIFILQKKYEEVREMARKHPADEELRQYAFIAMIQQSESVSGDGLAEVEAFSCGFLLGAVAGLLRAADPHTAEKLAGQMMEGENPKLQTADEKEELARVFKTFGRWDMARRLYIELAESERDDRKKNEAWLSAAHMAYCAGNIDQMEKALHEAKLLPDGGSEWAAQLKKWAGGMKQ